MGSSWQRALAGLPRLLCPLAIATGFRCRPNACRVRVGDYRAFGCVRAAAVEDLAAQYLLDELPDNDCRASATFSVQPKNDL